MNEDQDNTKPFLDWDDKPVNDPDFPGITGSEFRRLILLEVRKQNANCISYIFGVPIKRIEAAENE